MPTRDEVAPFLAEIAANFDDDTPRLIFADWLEEQGDPWAELIRVQCALARLFPADSERKELETRERELIAAHHDRWLRLLFDDGFENLRFRRGLIDVTLNAARFIADGARLFERSPMVAGVWLHEVAPVAGRLSRSERLRHLHTLNLSANLPAQQVLRAIVSDHLSQLAELSLCSVRVQPGDLEVLSRSPLLENLQSLNLSSQRVSLSSDPLADTDSAIFAGVSPPPRLRELKLATCGIHEETLTSFIDGGWLDRLTTLSLGYNHCRDAGLSLLVNRPAAVTLRSLSMPFNGVGVEGFAAVCRSPHLGSLEALNLRGNDLDDESALLFAESQRLPKLRCLDLRPDYQSNPRPIRGRRQNVRLSSRSREALRDRFGGRVLF